MILDTLDTDFNFKDIDENVKPILIYFGAHAAMKSLQQKYR